MLDTLTWNQSDLGSTAETLNMSRRAETCVGGNQTVDEFLDCLNTSFAERLLPAVSVLSVLMAMGVVGNILVLFMYTCKSKRGTVTLFIQALAVFDLLSCCVAIPGEIIDMTNNYTFGSHSLCKIMRTVNLFCTVSSGATLVVVAIDRYKRICCPLKRQITPKGATVVICICAISALVVSAPTVILYGGRSIATDLPSVNGTDCSISDQFVSTIFPLAYNGLQMFLFLVGAVTLIVLYSLIGSKVCHHINLQQVRRKSIGVGRSRFSPGGVSMTSIYSVNTNAACRVESDLASFVNAREVAELAERFQSTNTQTDAAVDVRETTSGSEKENCVQFNGDAGHNCTVVKHLTGRDVSFSVQGTECGKVDVNVAEPGLETTTFHLLENKFVDKCTDMSGKIDEKELMKNVPIVKDFVEEEINELKREVEPEEKRQILERIEGESIPENHTNNNTTSDDVSVIDSALKGHLENCQAEVSTEILVSTAGVACTQRDTCSQNVHEVSQQNFTSMLAQNNDLKDCTLLIVDPANVPVESSTVSPSAMPSDLSDESTKTNVFLTDPSTNFDRCKLPDLITEGIDIKRQQDKKLSDFSPLQSDKSNSEHTLQAYTSLMQTSKSTEINLNIDGKQYKKQNNHVANSNNLVSTPKTKKTKSCPKKPDCTSIVGKTCKTPLVRRMSRTACRSDSHLDRLVEKVKVREKEQSGSRRTTLMLLLITIVYVLSFLPHLIIMALKAVDQDMLKGLGTGWEVAENLLIRSYFINSMANPVIYSFFSRNFFTRCRSSSNRLPSG